MVGINALVSEELEHLDVKKSNLSHAHVFVQLAQAIDVLKEKNLIISKENIFVKIYRDETKAITKKEIKFVNYDNGLFSINYSIDINDVNLKSQKFTLPESFRINVKMNNIFALAILFLELFDEGTVKEINSYNQFLKIRLLQDFETDPVNFRQLRELNEELYDKLQFIRKIPEQTLKYYVIHQTIFI